MKKPLCALAKDWQDNAPQWDTRLNNYGYASLFWLSRGRKGARIRKYYAGVRTLIALAGGNIRYLLEIVDAAINIHFEEGYGKVGGRISIDPVAQTLAARAVGKRRLDQLEGLSGSRTGSVSTAAIRIRRKIAPEAERVEDSDLKSNAEIVQAALEKLLDKSPLEKYVKLAVQSAAPSSPTTSLMHVGFKENLGNSLALADFLWNQALNYALTRKRRDQVRAKLASAPNGDISDIGGPVNAARDHVVSAGSRLRRSSKSGSGCAVRGRHR